MTGKAVPINRLQAEIAAGRQDENLMAIVEAIGERYKTVAPPPWVIDFRGLRVTANDITVDEMSAVCERVGQSWDTVKEPVDDMAVARATIEVCSMMRLGTVFALGSVPVVELAQSLSREEGRAPLASPPAAST